MSLEKIIESARRKGISKEAIIQQIKLLFNPENFHDWQSITQLTKIEPTEKDIINALYYDSNYGYQYRSRINHLTAKGWHKKLSQKNLQKVYDLCFENGFLSAIVKIKNETNIQPEFSTKYIEKKSGYLINELSLIDELQSIGEVEFKNLGFMSEIKAHLKKTYEEWKENKTSKNTELPFELKIVLNKLIETAELRNISASDDIIHSINKHHEILGEFKDLEKETAQRYVNNLFHKSPNAHSLPNIEVFEKCFGVSYPEDIKSHFENKIQYQYKELLFKNKIEEVSKIIKNTGIPVSRETTEEITHLYAKRGDINKITKLKTVIPELIIDDNLANKIYIYARKKDEFMKDTELPINPKLMEKEIQKLYQDKLNEVYNGAKNARISGSPIYTMRKIMQDTKIQPKCNEKKVQKIYYELMKDGSFSTIEDLKDLTKIKPNDCIYDAFIKWANKKA